MRITSGVDTCKQGMLRHPCTPQLNNGGRTAQDARKQRFCFVAGPSLVVQEMESGHQTHLKQHCNSISCVLVTSDGQSIVSSDEGCDSQICVWDAESLQLSRTIKCPHSNNGVKAFVLTPDNNFLLTLAADSGSTETQDVALWDLSCPYPSARNRTVVPAGDVQRCLCINGDDPTEVQHHS